MAITLITGLPGHGKGVFSLDTINKLEQETGRPVYYHNVKDLALKWHQLDDPKQWINLPEGSIILLDEAWQTFPIRPNAQIPPEYVAQLATHRHKGYDIFIVTQQPTQLDTFVRKLVDKHYHIVRKFGAEAANVHEFVGLNPDPQKSRKNSIKHGYRYPKKVYEWYKSAEIHTVKTKRPLRIYVLWFGVPLFLAAAIFLAIKMLNPTSGAIVNGIKDQPGTKQESGGKILPSESPQPNIQSLTYVQAHTPEIPDLPYTAPVYREITKPVNAPYPAACLRSRSQGCKCFTQQGTQLMTSESVCKQIVEKGFFIEWQQNTEQAKQELKESPIGVSGRSPDVDQQTILTNNASLRALHSNSPAA